MMRRNRKQPYQLNNTHQRTDRVMFSQKKRKRTRLNKISSQPEHKFGLKANTIRKMRIEDETLEEGLARALRKQMKKQMEEQNKKKMERLWNFRKVAKKQPYVPEITDRPGTNQSSTDLLANKNNQQIAEQEQTVLQPSTKDKVVNNSDNNHDNLDNQNNHGNYSNHANHNNYKSNNENLSNHCNHGNIGNNGNHLNKENKGNNSNNANHGNHNNHRYHGNHPYHGNYDNYGNHSSNDPNHQNVENQAQDEEESTNSIRSNSKIKANISKVSQQSKLNACNISDNELFETVPFNHVELQRLRQYFDHICERMCKFPKNVTFQKAKYLFRTINQTEWMIFCKQMGITSKFKVFNEGIKLLGFIFRKNENIERRMNFEGFVLGLRQIAYEIIKKQQQTSEVTNLQQLKEIISLFCLDSKKHHLKKLQEIGVMCSLQSFSVPQSLLYNKSTPDKQNQYEEKRGRKNYKNYMNLQLDEQLDNRGEEKGQNAVNALKNLFPKIYKSTLERRESQLMHKLAITNINKLKQNGELKNSLEKFTDDDLFLKLYFDKQEKNRDEIAYKLNYSLKKGHY